MILNLTLGRFRQVRDVLFERQAEERRRHLQLEEIKLRTLAGFMARSEKAARLAREIVLVEPPQAAGVQVTRRGRRIGMLPAEMVGSMEVAV